MVVEKCRKGAVKHTGLTLLRTRVRPRNGVIMGSPTSAGLAM